MKQVKFSSIVFILIISLPTVFHFVSKCTGKTFDFNLSGYFDKVEYKPFSRQSYLTGEFQRSYETYLSSTIKLRGFFIKLYNQIQYSFFDISNRIIGKDKDIFEVIYIDSVCGLTGNTDFSIAENQIKLQEYVNHLQSIQDKLERNGKKFIFYTSLSKGNVDYGNIPYKYRCKRKDSFVSGYDYLKNLISKTSINYVDARNYLDNKDYPMFYKTGIHWSRPMEQTVSKAIVEKMLSISEKKLPEFVLTDLQSKNTPYWRDCDVLDLANVFQRSNEKKYFEYAISSPDFPFDEPNVLIQGGSFAEGFKKDYLEPYSNFYYINYNHFVQDKNNTYKHFNGQYQNIEIQKILDDVDFVIVEMNEGVINWFSNGFVAFLDEFLDSYIPSPKLQERVDSDVFDSSLELCPANKIGFYAFEGSVTWVKPESRIFLRNTKIKEKGLKISILIPSQVTQVNNGKMNLKITVNSKEVYNSIFSIPNEKIDLFFPAYDISSTNDTYDIKFSSDLTFIPKDLGINGDNRLLSFLISYIGEN